jgi:acylphosphatase
MSQALSSISFKIVGKVQGVFFRKHTVDKATELGLVGYVFNGTDGCVYGEAQGSLEALEELKYWLSNTASPQSLVKEAKFVGPASILECSWDKFHKLSGARPPLALFHCESS